MSAPATAHPSFVDLREFDRGRLDGPAADTIAQHLAECPTCQECIDQMPPDTFVGRLQSARPASGGTPFPPKTLDLPAAAKTFDLPAELANHPAYRVVGELGRGGMGVVYKAEHKLMGRAVALKVVPPEKLGDDETRDRFLNEIRAAAQLEHDNIVRAYGAEMIGRQFVLEMELVDGHSFDKVLAQKGTLPVAAACNFVRQAALGLQHMHERGLVHRDIKPQNLMVTRKGKVKVLDVGLARSTSGLDTRLTQSGVFMGTPDYISPEQIRNTRSADIRADVYSLGCTLYHLLSGRPPFVADDVMGVVAAHLTADAEQMVVLRPEVPAELSAVVAKMMARDAAARYQTPGELAKVLLPFCKAVPDGSGTSREAASACAAVSTASPPSPQGTGSPGTTTRRPRVKLAAVLVASAAGLALVVGLLWWGGALTTRVKTPYGTLVVTVNEPGATVSVDGTEVRVTRVGNEQVVVTALPGQKLEVRKAGFKAVAKELTLNPGEVGTTTFVLEPLGAGEKARSSVESPESALSKLLVKGSVWAGPIRSADKRTKKEMSYTLTMKITDRDGKQFRGTIMLDDGRSSLIEGMCDGNSITFRSDGVLQYNISGQLDGQNLVLKYLSSSGNITGSGTLSRMANP